MEKLSWYIPIQFQSSNRGTFFQKSLQAAEWFLPHMNRVAIVTQVDSKGAHLGIVEERNSSYLETTVKVICYITLVLPLVALAVKAVLRSLIEVKVIFQAPQKQPLFYAAKQDDAEGIRFLCSEGHSVNVEDEIKDVPLSLAAYHGADSAARALLEAGANPNHMDERGHTPLHNAAMNNKSSLIPVLAEGGADLEALSLTPRVMARVTALHLAAFHGHLETLEALIAAGSDVNSQSNNQTEETVHSTPLHYAAFSEEADVSILAALVENGADVNAKIGASSTPLEHATKAGNLEKMEFLLSKGADINDGSNWIGSPLCTATQKHDLGAMRFLIERGADLEATFDFGFTPLYSCAKSGFTEGLQFLLEQGGNPLALTLKGSSPLRECVRRGYEEGVRLILQHIQDSAPALDDAHLSLILQEARQHPGIGPIFEEFGYNFPEEDAFG